MTYVVQTINIRILIPLQLILSAKHISAVYNTYFINCNILQRVDPLLGNGREATPVTRQQILNKRCYATRFWATARQTRSHGN
jgi:hypothetical protein